MMVTLVGQEILRGRPNDAKPLLQKGCFRPEWSFDLHAFNFGESA